MLQSPAIVPLAKGGPGCRAADDDLVFRQRHGLRRPPVPASRHLRPGPGRPDHRGRPGRTPGPASAGHAEPVDLDGGTLLPGFIDAHAHPLFAGEQLRRCDLREATTAAGYVELDRGLRQGSPDEEWITGGGWSMDAFPGGLPTREPLDAVVPRPAGVPAQPRRARRLGQQQGARAGRASTGRPRIPPTAASSGTPAASPPACCRRAPRTWSPGCCRTATDEDWDAGPAGRPGPPAVAGHHRLAGRHRGQRPRRGADPTDAYLRAAQAGTLLANVVGALWWDRDRGLEQLPELLRAPAPPGRPGGSGPPA